MILFLARHGKAEVGVDDATRRLSAEGEMAVQGLAEQLARLDAPPLSIEHSPLVRARETAEIVSKRLGVPIVESSDLLPDSDVHEVRERLHAEGPESVMLVGHNPFMERFAALLLLEDEESTVLTFHAASAARFVSGASGLGRRYRCDLLLSPN